MITGYYKWKKSSREHHEQAQHGIQKEGPLSRTHGKVLEYLVMAIYRIKKVNGKYQFMNILKNIPTEQSSDMNGT